MYVLNEDKVCRFFAELSLRHAEKVSQSKFISVSLKHISQNLILLNLLSLAIHTLEGLHYHLILAMLKCKNQPKLKYLFIYYEKYCKLPQKV